MSSSYKKFQLDLGQPAAQPQAPGAQPAPGADSSGHSGDSALGDEAALHRKPAERGSIKDTPARERPGYDSEF